MRNLTVVFQSAAEPDNITRSVFKYWDFAKGDNLVFMNYLMELDGVSVVGVYRNGFFRI